jgi:hypothetical protein
MIKIESQFVGGSVEFFSLGKLKNVGKKINTIEQIKESEALLKTSSLF